MLSTAGRAGRVKYPKGLLRSFQRPFHFHSGCHGSSGIWFHHLQPRQGGQQAGSSVKPRLWAEYGQTKSPLEKGFALPHRCCSFSITQVLHEQQAITNLSFSPLSLILSSPGGYWESESHQSRGSLEKGLAQAEQKEQKGSNYPNPEQTSPGDGHAWQQCHQGGDDVTTQEQDLGCSMASGLVAASQQPACVASSPSPCLTGLGSLFAQQNACTRGAFSATLGFALSPPGAQTPFPFLCWLLRLVGISPTSFPTSCSSATAESRF